jgi:hypothetical protein
MVGWLAVVGFGAVVCVLLGVLVAKSRPDLSRLARRRTTQAVLALAIASVGLVLFNLDDPGQPDLQEITSELLGGFGFGVFVVVVFLAMWDTFSDVNTRHPDAMRTAIRGVLKVALVGIAVALIYSIAVNGIKTINLVAGILATIAYVAVLMMPIVVPVVLYRRGRIRWAIVVVVIEVVLGALALAAFLALSSMCAGGGCQTYMLSA